MIKYTPEKIKEFLLNNYNYKYISGDFNGIHSKLVCEDNNGYKLFCVIQKMIYRNQKAKIVHPNNPYSIYNINLFLSRYANNEYRCVSDNYTNNKQELEFIHLKCGRRFFNKWININRGRYLDNLNDNKTGIFCPHCNTKQLESTHALILKQVWKHEYPNTIIEDNSCINPKTNCVLPTDIVNHELKIAIEVQSWFHDFEKQKVKDNIKMNFWISKGYSFYALDHRDYTVIEMIQIFFKNINIIPDYIDFEYSNKINDVKIQNLLNENYSIAEIAEQLNCHTHRIYDAIYSKRVVYPEYYRNRNCKSVVQLDLNYCYVNKFDKISDAEKALNICGIANALRNGRNYCGGYYWIETDKYISGNYSIVPTRLKKIS